MAPVDKHEDDDRADSRGYYIDTRSCSSGYFRFRGSASWVRTRTMRTLTTPTTGPFGAAVEKRPCGLCIGSLEAIYSGRIAVDFVLSTT